MDKNLMSYFYDIRCNKHASQCRTKKSKGYTAVNLHVYMYIFDSVCVYVVRKADQQLCHNFTN